MCVRGERRGNERGRNKESIGGETITGSAPDLSLTETVSAGHADTAGKTAAENLGTFPSNGAVHDGTSTTALDVSQGLVSALILQEPNESGMTGYGSWVTHPSTIDHRRQGPSGGGIPGTGAVSLIPRQMAHRRLGPGFLESVYEKDLIIELIPFSVFRSPGFLVSSWESDCLDSPGKR